MPSRDSLIAFKKSAGMLAVFCLATIPVCAIADDSIKPLLGDWDITIKIDDGREFSPILKVNNDGDKVGGVFVSDVDGVEVPLDDAKIEQGKLTFSIERDFNGSTLTAQFSGQVENGVLKGTIDFELDQQQGQASFEGKRAQNANLTGKWKIKLSAETGDEFVTFVVFKQQGDKLSGVYTSALDGSEIEFADGSVKDGKVSFTVSRDRDGDSMSVKYTGTLADNQIKGDVELDSSFQKGTGEFEASRAE